MTLNQFELGKIIEGGLDEIIFQNRYKDYGAYDIRKKYRKALTIAYLIAFSIILTATVVPFINALLNQNERQVIIENTAIVEMEKIEEEKAPPPPPPPPPPPAVEQQIKYTAPVVVDSVKEEVIIATADEQKEIVAEAPPEELIVEEAPKEVVVEVEEAPFVVVEEPATFQGGDLNTFRTWIAQNLKYPAIAAENGITGKVFVQFVVNKQGKVVDVVVLRSVDPALDKEAIRVVSSSPDWTPPKQGGRAVKQVFTLPITFVLQ